MFSQRLTIIYWNQLNVTYDAIVEPVYIDFLHTGPQGIFFIDLIYLSCFVLLKYANNTSKVAYTHSYFGQNGD